MFSTEELTIAAMRRGRDGTVSPNVRTKLIILCRCYDVHECRCGAELSSLLLACLCGRLQRLSQITPFSQSDLSELGIVSTP